MDLAKNLDRLKKQGLYRCRRVHDGAQDTIVNINGKRLLNFCSNDYLGLAAHPDIVNAFKKGAERYGVGSGSAHLICGHTQAHHALEEELAEFCGRRRALLFSTGYMANMGVITALLGQRDRVLEDRLNHASLLDGGLLSRAEFKRFGHTDMDDLQQKLADSERRSLIVTDGVFSMDGDLAPLPEMVKLAKAHRAVLMVDDAHGIGVLGQQGGGVLEHFGLSEDEVPVLMGTLGKALGTFGAFVAGSDELVETLIQQARTYIYTTAIPSAIAEATRVALRIIRRESWRREKLCSLCEYFRTGAKQLGLPLMDSTTAIQPLLIGDSERAVVVGDALLNQGLWVGAIRPPTVPKGKARLRITLSTKHEYHHIDTLLNGLASCL